MQKGGSFMQPYDMKELEERVILVGVQERFFGRCGRISG